MHWLFLVLGIFFLTLMFGKPPVDKKTGKTASRGMLVAASILLSLIFLLLSFSYWPVERDRLPLAKEYKVMGSKDFSYSGRNRMTYYIKSSATTTEERIHTLLKAALDDKLWEDNRS